MRSLQPLSDSIYCHCYPRAMLHHETFADKFGGTERDAMAAGQLGEHLYRRLPLGPAGRGYHAGRRDQAARPLRFSINTCPP